ncbi:MAG TPA: PASTA domain-containing protein [Nitrospinota bacterium]|nr:PASTA domain-containing protein [Nitrospinota bacterium]
MFRFDPSLQGQAIVPRVLNQRAPNAQQTLRGRGLGFRVAGFVNTNNQGLHNRVARQSPGPNARVRQGTVVSVTLFTAQQGSVTVPNVLNQTLGVAQSALLRQGLRFRVAGSVNTGNRGQTNRVARQSPGPNARVGRGTVVGLTLYRFAQAPPPRGAVVVPSVINQPLGRAQQVITRSGLRFRVAGTVNTTNRNFNGRVARQNPPRGRRVSRGKVVTLTLFRFAQAPPPQGAVVVPSVINQPLGSAQQALTRSGLRFRVAGTVNTTNRNFNGRVARQNPPRGRRVSRGTVVTLTLYRFAQAPPPQGAVVVPSVVNQPIQNAIRILRQAGLRPGSAAFVPSRDPNRNLRVRTQSPRAGARINRGGRVDLVVFFHSP